MARLKAAVLASGRGSNLQALLDASQHASYPVEVALVLSNVPGAYALERARLAGVAAQVIDHRAYADRPSFEAALDESLRAAAIDFVCLAGFMRLLTSGFVAAWHGRMINIHPSLLPSFKGLHTHRRALEAGVKLHGCTVHFVSPDLDDGPIIAQAAVPVLTEDDETSLAARVLAEEHRLYPHALRLLGEQRLAIEGRVVRVSA